MTRIRYTMPARSQGKLHMQRRVAKLVEKDVHRWVFVYGMDSDVEALHGGPCVCVRIGPTEATLGLCDRLSNPLIEVDAVVHKGIPLDCVCDLGYGIAPGTVIDEGTIPDYHVLWPGKPTTNTVWTAVEDYTWFEAFSEEGCATGVACTPASHMQDRRKE